MRLILIALLVSTLQACSGIDIEQYRSNTPKLDLYEYFEGKTVAWGIVQDRKGVLTRQFTVDIVGTVNEKGELVLDELFSWSDGTTSTRVWTIARDGERYVGTAPDVAGEAVGVVAGNALNWKYQLEIEYDGSTWLVNLDDWMFLADEEVLINRAKMSKFGLFVGDITLFFQKKEDR